MFKNAKIRTKFLIGYGIILIMLLISTGYSYYNFSLIGTTSTVPIQKIKLILSGIFVVSTIISVFIALFFSYKITAQLNENIAALNDVASGNLKVKRIRVDSKDEFGQLGNAINLMQDFMKDMVKSIVGEVKSIINALEISNNDISELAEKLEEISAVVEQLSAGMEETSASTEEINASSNEFETAASVVADKAQKGSKSANEINTKAVELKENSIKNEEEAKENRVHIKKVVDDAIKKARNVEKIKKLSNSILAISSQTNLLALNASIESARAGESGRGFSVVADEIRKLSESSKEIVEEIQNAINEVFDAVNELSSASKEALEYIETKVVKSYEESVLVGENYHKDAVYIDNLVSDLSATSEELLASVKTVSEAIDEISKASSEGAEGTNYIADKVSKIKDKSKEMRKELKFVKESSEHLKGIVSKFDI